MAKYTDGADVNTVGGSGIVASVVTDELLSTPDITPPSGVDPLAPPKASGRRRIGSADARKARDLKSEDVDVPEWGGEGAYITIRALTSAERDAFESSLRVKRNGKDEVNTINMRAKLVVLCAVDEFGHRVWSDDDASWLGDKSSGVLSRLYDVATRLSGISKEDAEALEKNSKGTTGDNS